MTGPRMNSAEVLDLLWKVEDAAELPALIPAIADVLADQERYRAALTDIRDSTFRSAIVLRKMAALALQARRGTETTP